MNDGVLEHVHILHKNTRYSMSVVLSLFTMKDWDTCGTDCKVSERLIEKL